MAKIKRQTITQFIILLTKFHTKNRHRCENICTLIKKKCETMFLIKNETEYVAYGIPF